jgi:WD40 repeat protein
MKVGSNDPYLAVVTEENDRVIAKVGGTNGHVIDTFTTHRHVTALALSRNDRYLAAGSIDGSITVWNWEQPDICIRLDAVEGVRSLDFENSRDRTYLAAAGDATVRVWSLSDGGHQEPPQTFKRQSGDSRSQVASVKSHPNNGHLWVVWMDGTISVWDGIRSKESRIWNRDPKLPRIGDLSLHLHPSWNEVLAAGFAVNRIDIWSTDIYSNFPDLNLKSEGLKQGLTAPSEVHCYRYSPCGNYILTSHMDETRVWDSRTMKFLHIIKDATQRLYFSASGRYLVCVKDGVLACQIRMWDFENEVGGKLPE